MVPSLVIVSAYQINMDFIPTGADTSVPGNVCPSEKIDYPFLLFAGEYLREYGDDFLILFKRAVQIPFIQNIKLKLLIIGNMDINKKQLAQPIESHELADHIMFIDHMPQSRLYTYIKAAVAGILIPGTSSHYWTNFAKMADYIAFQKPVLAIVPDPSEARTQLLKAGNGIFLDGSADAALEKLINFLMGKVTCKPNLEFCERYTARAQVQAFIRIFESLLDEQRKQNGSP